MQALVFDGAAAGLRSDWPRPACQAEEALVAVRVAGICRTDLEILKGYMGFRGVMGHEFVGQVVQGPARWVGKRVVAEINCVCGQCDMCCSGLANHCRRRTVLGIDGHDGVFAEFVQVPLRNLHEVPAGVSDDQAVFVEPLAAAFQILRQVSVSESTQVVVLGDGRLGQLCARVLKTRSAQVLMVGKHEAKLAAAEKHGIRTLTRQDYAPARSADIVVDATGSASGFEMAIRACRPRGVIVLKSTFAADAGLNLAPVVVDELTVLGSRCGPFADALAALRQRQVEVTDLISRRYSLRDGPAALEAAARGDTFKVLIDVI